MSIKFETGRIYKTNRGALLTFVDRSPRAAGGEWIEFKTIEGTYVGYYTLSYGTALTSDTEKAYSMKPGEYVLADHIVD